MGKRTYFVGSVAVTAGLLVAGTPAFADTYDNDGINIGNDNNASVAPIQLCGNNIAVLGAVVPVLSPQKVHCVNAPIVDHPKQEGDKDKPRPEKPGDHDKCDHDNGKCDHDKGDHDKGDHDKGDHDKGDHDKGDKSRHPSGDRELPTAPTPVSVAGHAAVTG